MKMFSLKKLGFTISRLRSGFTMIELLIVIAVLGILAVAVLASINPIEQINRGRDTGSRSDAEQLISAVDRFYASKGYYPWQLGVSSQNYTTYTPVGTPAFVALSSLTVAVGVDAQPMLTNLSASGTEELKSSFTTRISNTAQTNTLSIFNKGTAGSSTYVCFIPKSSSFREEAWTRCTNAAHTARSTSLPADYPGIASTTGSLACPDTSCATAATSTVATGCYICLP